MTSFTRQIIPAIVAGALAFTATAAIAAPGLVRTSSAAVHSKASSGSRIVAVLHKADYVIVKSCGASWCRVHNVNLDGYVLRTQLYNPYYGKRSYFQFPPVTHSPGR